MISFSITMQKSNIVKINEHDEIKKFSNKNHVRFYNSEKRKLIYTRRKAKVRTSKFNDLI